MRTEGGMADTLGTVKGRAGAGERPARGSTIVAESGPIPQARRAPRGPAQTRAKSVVWVTLVLAGCRPGLRLPTVSAAWDALGTICSVAAWGGDSARVWQAVAEARDSVRLVDSLLSADRPESELSRVNRGRAGESLSPTFRAVLSTALGVVRQSGALDAAGSGWRGVVFDSAAARVRLSGHGALDLEWIAKGYALDRALLPLRTVADSAVLTIGGQYLIMSSSHASAVPRTGRSVGVVDPSNTLATLATIEVPSGVWAVSTTSPVERPDQALVPEARRQRQTVRAVTTLAHDAAIAMAWSTEFFRMGCDSALARARALDGLEVMCADDRVRWSPGLEGRIWTPRDSAGRTGRGAGPGLAPPAARVPSDSRKPAASPGSSRSDPRTS
jgi:thiamine biosynthesis lipoprotein ApbE